ncbi:TIGR02281 family clan AA aspartic protease [Pleomorphomonas sp. PLEO]|uniref:retropepsin-like aspartic protease family protein n=1 Tax=Pleomorphomonas sp. PLEO TaxID=3239306 RepID=UPI00351EAEA8
MVSATYKLGDGYVYAETVADTATGKILAEVSARCIERSSLAGNFELLDTAVRVNSPLAEQRPVSRPNPDRQQDFAQRHPDLGLSAQFNMSGGTPQVPVLINDRLSLDFIIDSGASDVSIPSDVALTLVRTGTIADNDFLGASDYTLADGRTSSASRINIRSLSIGGITIRNVTASVANAAGPLLLGESFLTRLPKWTINNETRAFEFDRPDLAEMGPSPIGPSRGQSAMRK